MIQDIAPHKLINEFRPDAVPRPEDPVFVIRGRELLVKRTGDHYELPLVGEFPAGGYIRYLFAIDETPYYLYAGETATLPAGCSFLNAREARRNPGVPPWLSFAAYTAIQLTSWYRDNCYCGTCGGRTKDGTIERSILCPQCGRVIYPRIVPAVIVGVTNGDYLLHTKYERSRDIPYYALVAGFTEIGETLEETVAREVMEETGLRVKNIRYFKSQPWGIADDILAGFYCDVDGDPTICIDTRELCEGIWVHRKDIVGQPDDASLTHHMMMTFREGREPGGR